MGILRPIASAFFQLKLGHGYLKSYLYRLKIVSNNKYKYSKTKNTKHLLLYYILYREECFRLFSLFKGSLEASAFNLRLLLYTEIGILNILVFLKETSIYIRKWYIKRSVEMEEVKKVEIREEIREEIGEEIGEGK